MKIPREFQLQLAMHINAELLNPNQVKSPVEVAESCVQFTRRWFGLDEAATEFAWPEGQQLVAYSARFGKAVAEAWYTNKGG